VTAVPPTPEPAPPPPPQVKPPNNWIGIAVLAGFVACGAGLMSPDAPHVLVFAFVMLGWTLSVMAHEFCHALTAYVGGDWTVRPKGYLAFDPRRYGDLGTSLVLPLIFLALGGIGFPGGAVWLNMGMIRSPFMKAAAALAGPAATGIIFLVLAAIVRVWGMQGAQGALFPALAFLCFLQATALVLNLIPLPGLDGFGAIRPFLPASWTAGLRRVEGLVMVGLFLILFLSPEGGRLLFGTAARLTAGLGVPLDAVQWGYDAFRFWRTLG
jgi:Zn-dependent protease